MVVWALFVIVVSSWFTCQQGVLQGWGIHIYIYIYMYIYIYICKSPLLSWKVFTWIMVKTCVPYTSHKIHLILKFIEIDEASVNLLHNYSKSGWHGFKNFNNSRKLYIWCFNPCYHNLPIRICSCACICWLFQFTCSAYCFLYKWRFAAFHLSRVGIVLY